MANTWIRKPTPVTIRVISAESGSHNSSRLAPMAGIQDQSRMVVASPSPWKNGNAPTNPTRNERPIAADARRPAMGSGRRWPTKWRKSAPASGSRITNQRRSIARSVTARPLSVLGTWYSVLGRDSRYPVPSTQYAASEASCPSSLHLRELIDRGGGSQPEDRDDDGETDHDLGGGHDEDEEHGHLAVAVVERAAGGDQGQVHRVEHQLDAHEHDQRVAPDEEAQRPDQEQGGGERHIPTRCDHQFLLRSWARATVPAAPMVR